MKKTITLAVALVALAGFSAPVTAKGTYKATLKGANEVPPVETKTRGKAFFKFRKENTEVEFTLRVQKGDEVTMAHLHCGADGVNGVVAVTLAGEIETGHDVNGKWITKVKFGDDDIADGACVTNVDELATAMKDGEIYVNVHTVANPAGEIRGQVGKSGKGKK